MSGSLTAEREKIQRQIEALEQTLGTAYSDMENISSETSSDDGSDDDDGDYQGPGQPLADLCVKRERVQREILELEAALGGAEISDEDEDEDSASEEPPDDLCLQREKVQREIQQLEAALGGAGPLVLSDDDDDDDDGDDEGGSSAESDSELQLSQTPETCLHMNLVYQQVLQEKLDELEKLLRENKIQQKDVVSQLNGGEEIRIREREPPTSYQQPTKMYLGRFIKPYFKCKLTGLGPPANPETKEKASKMNVQMDDNKLKLKKWEGWQKRLIINSVANDCLKRLLQPKLSKVAYLSQKMSKADHVEKLILNQQILQLEREMEEIKASKEEDLIGGRYDDHDWAKISNIDFEGTKEAEDIQHFWQNLLHPSLNKSSWSKEEITRLREVTGRHGERDWEGIAEELGTGRTPFMCLQTYQRYLSHTFKRRRWTPEEDSVLKDLVGRMRIGNFIPYTSMSYFMEGRQPSQLMYRWMHVLDPSIHKGFWTKEEDELLMNAVARHGEKHWWKIRMEVPGRTDGSCRDRYMDTLKAGTKKGPFNQEEKALLVRLVKKHGAGRWSRIAAEIPHRIDAQCLRAWKRITDEPVKPGPFNLEERALLVRLVEKHGAGRWSRIAEEIPHRMGNQCRAAWKQVTLPKAGGTVRRRRRRRAVRSIRRRLDRLEELSDDEVVYMDSDEEEEGQVEQVRQEVIPEEEDEEEEYAFPPMEAWVPVEKKRGAGILKTQLVALPTPTDSTNRRTPVVRSTILNRFGQHVDTFIGPAPQVLHKKYHHSVVAVVKVPFGEIRSLMLWTSACSRKVPGSQKGFRGNKRQPIRTDRSLQYDLMAAMTPWIGHLLLPKRPFTTRRVDVVRQRVQSMELPSTPIFLLFLQVLTVDVVGCKDMITERRREGFVPQTPAHLIVKAPKAPRLDTVAGMLEQKRLQQAGRASMPFPHMAPPPRPHISQQPLPSGVVSMTPARFPHFAPLSPLHISQQPLPGVVVSMPPMMLPGQPMASFPASPMRLMIGPLSLSPRFSSPAVVQVMLPQAPPPQTLQHRLLTPNQMTPPVPPPGQTVSSSPPIPPSQSWPVSAPPLGPPAPLPPGVVLLSPPGVRPAWGLTPTSPSLSSPHLHASSPPAIPPISAPPRPALPLPSTPASQQAPACLPSTSMQPGLSNQSAASPCPPPVQAQRGRKRPLSGGREEGGEDAASQQGVVGSPESACDSQESVSSSSEGKRVRTLSTKAKALRDATEAKVEAKRVKATRRRKRGHQQSTSFIKEPIGLIAPRPPKTLAPRQDLWMMTANGLVPVVGGIPPGLQLVPTANANHPTQPMNMVVHQMVPPPLTVFPNSNPAQPMNVFIHQQGPSPPTLSTALPPVGLPSDSSPQVKLPSDSSPQVKLPSGSSPQVKLPSDSSPQVKLPSAPPPRVKADPSAHLPSLKFDRSLMFCEPHGEVCDWLSGQGGVVVSGLELSLPYMPPFISSLISLGNLLKAKRSLTVKALQLLPPEAEPSPASNLSSSSAHSPSTEHNYIKTAPSPASETSEVERVAAVRHIIAERFSDNPAYQLLKARFLSCFTLPALLATMQPPKHLPTPPPAREDEGEDEEEQALRRMKENALLSVGVQGPPAAHYCGIITRNTTRQLTRPDQTAPDQTAPDQTAPDQTAPDQTPPDQTAPDQTAPDQIAPDQIAPDQIAPDQIAPDQIAPDQTAPDQMAPDQMAPDQTAPDQTPPDPR